MAMQVKWMRENMLGSPAKSNRKLTEAELKVQRSLQKLSIPEWYLNRRSDPPKILNSRHRLPEMCPAWKNATPKKFANDTSTTSEYYSDPDKEIVAGTKQVEKSTKSGSTSTYKVPRRNLAALKPQREMEPVFSNADAMNINLPKWSFPANLSGTFPKVSPSRKIENINIILPSPPKVDLVASACETLRRKSLRNDSKFMTFDKKQRNTDNEVLRSESLHEDIRYNTFEKNRFARKKASHHVNILERNTDLLWKAPSKKLAFKNKVEVLKNKFETATNDTHNSNTKSKSASESESASDIKSKHNFTPISGRKSKPVSVNKSDAGFVSNVELIKASNIKCTCKSRPSSPSNKLDDVPRVRRPESESEDEAKEMTTLNTSVHSYTDVSDDQSTSSGETYFNSPKKSTEMQNIVRKKHGPWAGRTLVRSIVEELNRKCEVASTGVVKTTKLGANTFVKKFVNALETSGLDTAQELLAETRKVTGDYETESASESDIKSMIASTTISTKDSDSSSDFDHMSPSPTNENLKFRFKEVPKTTCNDKISSTDEEDDEVYWIPVPRHHLLRSSSLLSVSRVMPTNVPTSPCVSPIAGGNENCRPYQYDTWMLNYNVQKMSRSLFRINETSTDSGISDKSDTQSFNVCSPGVYSSEFYANTAFCTGDLIDPITQAARLNRRTNIR